MLETEGTGLVTARVSGDEPPPPGAALKTVIDRVPATAMSEAGIDAVN